MCLFPLRSNHGEFKIPPGFTEMPVPVPQQTPGRRQETLSFIMCSLNRLITATVQPELQKSISKSLVTKFSTFKGGDCN